MFPFQRVENAINIVMISESKDKIKKNLYFPSIVS